MTPEVAEKLERTTMEMVVQAIVDYLDEAKRIFREESDLAQDIAEDVMREAVEAMGVSGFQERLYGKVDYKKAVYVFIPEAYPVGSCWMPRPRKATILQPPRCRKHRCAFNSSKRTEALSMKKESCCRRLNGAGALSMSFR